MGVYTLGTGTTNFRSDLKLMMDTRTDISNNQFHQWINWTYMHVSRPNIHLHRELFTSQDIVLVTGTRTYTQAADLRAIHDVYNVTQGYRILPETIRRQDDRPTINARPARYSAVGGLIELDNAPTASENGHVIRVRYWRRPVILSANGDATVIGEEWDEIILVGASYRGWRQLNAVDRADFYRDEYARLIREVQDYLRIEGEIPGRRAEPEIMSYSRV